MHINKYLIDFCEYTSICVKYLIPQCLVPITWHPFLFSLGLRPYLNQFSSLCTSTNTWSISANPHQFVSSTWYVSAWYPVLGTLFLFSSTWYQVLGTWVPHTWNQVAGAEYLVPSAWYQVGCTALCTKSIPMTYHITILGWEQIRNDPLTPRSRNDELEAEFLQRAHSNCCQPLLCKGRPTTVQSLLVGHHVW